MKSQQLLPKKRKAKPVVTTITTHQNNAVAASQAQTLAESIVNSHNFPSVTLLPTNMSSSMLQESTSTSDAGGDKSKVIINGMVIDIETITSEELYALRKVLPKKDYRLLKNRKSARKSRRRRKEELHTLRDEIAILRAENLKLKSQLQQQNKTSNQQQLEEVKQGGTGTPISTTSTAQSTAIKAVRGRGRAPAALNIQTEQVVANKTRENSSQSRQQSADKQASNQIKPSLAKQGSQEQLLQKINQSIIDKTQQENAEQQAQLEEQTKKTPQQESFCPYVNPVTNVMNPFNDFLMLPTLIANQLTNLTWRRLPPLTSMFSNPLPQPQNSPPPITIGNYVSLPGAQPNMFTKPLVTQNQQSLAVNTQQQQQHLQQLMGNTNSKLNLNQNGQNQMIVPQPRIGSAQAQVIGIQSNQGHGFSRIQRQNQNQ
eukprot:403330990